MTDEPTEARRYIALFRSQAVGRKIDWVETNERKIQLDHMTDAEAVFVASEFRRMEIDAALRFAGRPRPQ